MVDRPPPSRYRITEHNRRLQVIDTWVGTDHAVPVTIAPPTPATPPRASVPSTRLDLVPSAPQPVAGAADAGIGLGEFTTQRWYDTRAPRTIRLTDASRSTMTGVTTTLIGTGVVWLVAAMFLPWLFLLPAVLFHPVARAAARGAVTAWLDRLARR